MAKTSGLKTGAPRINIGIDEADRAAVAQELSKLLADSYTLYLMTHNFHWNVTGPYFSSLHELFMNMYTEIWQALDNIAERIRALGHFAPGTYREYVALSSIEEPHAVPAARDMVSLLVAGNESVAKTARSAFSKVEAVNDQATAELLTERLHIHEKNAWMLRSLLED
jgi:starvation-inducible DNA-binding protein